MSGLFKPTKERVKLRELPISGAQRAGQEFLTTQLDQPFKPFTGERVAPLTEAERLGQTALTEFAGRAPSPLFGLAETELAQTLGGEFDPATSPFFQATRRAMGREIEQAVRGVRRGAELGGTLFGGVRPGLEAETRLGGRTELARILGALAETERGRRFQAAPLALQAGQFLEEAPLRTAAAVQQFGGLPRELEQAGLDVEFEEFLREQQFPFQQSDLARLLLGTEPTFMPAEEFGPSPFAQTADLVAALFGGRGG